MKRTKSRGGYSLVEVTLALLVVAIGLTATFALFPDGLAASRAAVDDTEISLFAEYVFTTLDLTAIAKGANWKVSDAAMFKSLALAGTETDDRFRLRETSEGSYATFYWVPDTFGLYGTDYDPSKFDQYWTSAFTYQLGLYDWEDGSTYARLVVWPGEYPSGTKPPDKLRRVFTRAVQTIRGEALK